MVTKKDIEEVFSKQLKRINDPELADKVAETWVLGCKRGGWNSMSELKEVPFTLLTATTGISLVDHTIAVTEGAIGLALAQEGACALPYKINMDRLIAGGILHDVGKLLEIEKSTGKYQKSLNGKHTRHPISGAILAAEMNFPDGIINTIACHAKEGDGRPQVVETVLIHQADFACFNPLTMLASNTLIV